MESPTNQAASAAVEATAGDSAAAGATSRTRGPAKTGSTASPGSTTSQARFLVFIGMLDGSSIEPAFHDLRSQGPVALESPDQLGIRRGPDHPVELGAVARDEADVLDQHVVDEPAITLLQQPGLDRHLRPVLGDDDRPDDGPIPVDPLAHVLDPLPAELADPRQVGLLEETPED